MNRGCWRLGFWAFCCAILAGGPRPAQANVFGVASSPTAAEIIAKCNAHYTRAHDLYVTLQRMEGLEWDSNGARRGSWEEVPLAPNSPEAVALLSDVARWVSSAPEVEFQTSTLEADIAGGAADATVLRTAKRAAEQLFTNAVAAFHEAGCADVIAGSLSSHLESNLALPPLTSSVGTEVRFHFGASITGNTGAGEGSEANADFAPALGVSYATNAVAGVLLIDPNVLDAGGTTLPREDTSDAFGRNLLEANLGSQALYASYTRYPWRTARMTRGYTLRLVARRMAFSVDAESEGESDPSADEGSDGDEGTPDEGTGEGDEGGAAPENALTNAEELGGAFQVQGVFLAPTLAFTMTTSGLEAGDDEFVVGLQAGVTMRAFAGDLGALASDDRALLIRTERDKARHGVWAAGGDVTFFMRYRDVAPFARLTALHGPDWTPRSMKGVQAVFGLDVLAGIRLGPSPPEPSTAEPASP